MAKKNKKNKEQLPEGMSRRQAKLAARAAERAALEKVLPGASAALIRDEQSGGQAFVGLQVKTHSHNPGRDLAYALNWVKNHGEGETLESTVADGTEPKITELLDNDAILDVEVYQDFAWWLPEGAQVTPQIAQSMQMANDSVIESHPVGEGIVGTAFWANAGGGKAHIRWVRPEEFVEHADYARELGFGAVMSGPLVRSSYRAGRLYVQALEHRGEEVPEHLEQLKTGGAASQEASSVLEREQARV